MVPGIFNHMQIEHDSSDDDAFGRKKKSGKKNSLTELVDGIFKLNVKRWWLRFWSELRFVNFTMADDRLCFF